MRFRSTLIALCCLAAPVAVHATGLTFEAELSRAQEVPAPGPGLITDASVRAEFAEDLSSVEVTLHVDGGQNVVGAHFHCALPGASGPVAFGMFSPGPLTYDGSTAAGTLTNNDFVGADCMQTVGRPVNNIAALALAMREGLIYANVHTEENGPGEVRGQMLEIRDADGDGGPPFGRGMGHGPPGFSNAPFGGR